MKKILKITKSLKKISKESLKINKLVCKYINNFFKNINSIKINDIVVSITIQDDGSIVSWNLLVDEVTDTFVRAKESNTHYTRFEKIDYKCNKKALKKIKLNQFFVTQEMFENFKQECDQNNIAFEFWGQRF